MAKLTNNDRVAKALEKLATSLSAYVAGELQKVFGANWSTQITPELRGRAPNWDTAGALNIVAHTQVFKNTLGRNGMSYVHELIEARNCWAHQEAFSTDNTERVLDTARRLLEKISDTAGAAELAEVKADLSRSAIEQKVRNEKRSAQYQVVNGQITRGLSAWREVAVPHADVLSERFNNAEFAADLWQVAFGNEQQVASEYKNPVEFFRRTFLTESLRRLIKGALTRLAGRGGDPVVQLQTNFGGGKTHSMLALYHLFSDVALKDLPGLDEVLERGVGGEEGGVREATTLTSHVRRVVLGGTKISASGLEPKHDGTRVKTLWGELAWQLGGREAFEMVRIDDENATNPGNRLDTLLKRYGPALILIDEWVAYARGLPDKGDGRDLPGGDFETQFTFAQALTEAVEAAGNALLVVSLPASDSAGQGDEIELGGPRGSTALSRLDNVVRRKAAAWQPASAEESFMIVRRRLFEPLTAETRLKCDITARAFAELYRAQRQDFPSGCAESDFERRLREAYPVHPEVFARLYTDWGGMAKFQRTRGVLRLLAGVIRTLWQNGDATPLILPAHLPVAVLQNEWLRYLESPWGTIIGSEVDGADSLPARLDAANPNLGKFSACRRVTRTVFLGSAPQVGVSNRGLDDKRVKLGCVMPGETPAVFGDALRRLGGEATYLHQDGTRSWFDTAPTLNRMAANRAEELKGKPEVDEEIRRRVNENIRRVRGDFGKIHNFPASSGDVPDEMETRLVVLAETHSKSTGGNGERTAGLRKAAEILEQRGNAPRIYRNTLIFLAADTQKLGEVADAVRLFLAWRSIVEDEKILNLTTRNKEEAGRARDKVAESIAPKLEEAFCWLLVPRQDTPSSAVAWDEWKLSGGGIVGRVAKKLRSEDALCEKLGASVLRREADKVPLWRDGDDGAGGKAHVALRQLAKDFASYLYLARLKGPETLRAAIVAGVDDSDLLWGESGFAYADGYDADKHRYLGLVHGKRITLPPDGGSGLIVKGSVAVAQIAADAAAANNVVNDDPSEKPAPGVQVPAVTGGTPGGGVLPVPTEPKYRRFHGSVALPTTAAGKMKFGEIYEAVIAHLAKNPNADVRVTLEIAADFSDIAGGAGKDTKRTVETNTGALGFQNAGWE
ncbi:MAG: DUF499 domain-containing protein [Puniceicoccales bacterium]|jgi:predicted AAA+ superfamily ATPase|nr:DUF499 domain-containing protein [Puniceicoccales bacterium]